MPTPNLGRAPANASQTPSEPLPSSQPHPLQREGAIIFLSPAEQAMEDSMTRSSPPPEPVLGKQTRHPADGSDTESDNGTPSTTQAQSLPYIISNVLVAAASLRYASKKKLRPEQHDEVDIFLLVIAPLTYLWYLCLNIG